MNFVWRHIALSLFVLAVVMLLGFAGRRRHRAFCRHGRLAGVWLAMQLYYVLKLARWLVTQNQHHSTCGRHVVNDFRHAFAPSQSRKKRKQKLGAALQRFEPCRRSHSRRHSDSR